MFLPVLDVVAGSGRLAAIGSDDLSRDEGAGLAGQHDGNAADVIGLADAAERQQLLALVWEHDYLGDSRLVDACVQRLRAKIEDDSASPTYIQTVRGFGYRFGPL